MSLEILLGNDTYSLRFDSFDSKTKEIKCIGCNERETKTEAFAVDFPLQMNSSLDSNEYRVFFFYKKDLKENDIFQIFSHDDKRLAWCIPIQALSSIEHSFSENEHFIQVASIASKLIIDNPPEREFLERPNFDSKTDQLNLSDFFKDSISVIILWQKAYSAPISNATIEAYLPNLLKYGYVMVDRTYKKNIYWGGEKVLQNKIKVDEISNDIFYYQRIINNYKNHLGQSENSLFCFFYIYQIIELLLSQIQRNELQRTIIELSNHVPDYTHLSSTVNSLSKIKSHKELLKLLLTTYCDQSVINSSSSSLLAHCNSYLSLCNEKQVNSLHEAIYEVRNLLFHKYLLVNDSSIESILAEIIAFIATILSNFRCNEDFKANNPTHNFNTYTRIFHKIPGYFPFQMIE